jgi:hypothetical protein
LWNRDGPSNRHSSRVWLARSSGSLDKEENWHISYSGMIFEIFIEAADTLGVELNDLFTKGVSHKL